MKRKTLFVALSLLSGSVTAFAWKAIESFATATDLYAYCHTSGVCIRLVTTSNVIASSIITSGFGIQAQIISNSGTAYDLYENNTCTRPVYFVGC